MLKAVLWELAVWRCVQVSNYGQLHDDMLVALSAVTSLTCLRTYCMHRVNLDYYKLSFSDHLPTIQYALLACRQARPESKLSCILKIARSPVLSRTAHANADHPSRPATGYGRLGGLGVARAERLRLFPAQHRHLCGSCSAFDVAQAGTRRRILHLHIQQARTSMLPDLVSSKDQQATESAPLCMRHTVHVHLNSCYIVCVAGAGLPPLKHKACMSCCMQHRSLKRSTVWCCGIAASRAVCTCAPRS